MMFQHSDSSELLKEYPFRVEFKGEQAIDAGGVCRDFFRRFFKLQYFDGSSLLTPVVNPHFTKSEMALLGLVFSHAYLSSGVLPTRISFPCLSMMLLGNLPDHIMADTFVSSLSLYDATVVRQGLEWSKESEFSTELQTSLIAILSMYDCREIPKQKNLEIARHHFFRKPAATITDIHAGVPAQHAAFWSKITAGMLYDVYTAMMATNGKVLSMIADTETSNANEERVLGYLRKFIGDLRKDELFLFLRFVTGTQACTTKSRLTTRMEQPDDPLLLVHYFRMVSVFIVVLDLYGITNFISSLFSLIL